MRYYGHIVRQTIPAMEGAILTGLVPGDRKVGAPSTAWIDNVFDWSELPKEKVLQTAKNRDEWRKLMHHNYVLPSKIDDG